MRLGIRAQLLLALFAILVLAFTPLLFATSSLTRAGVTRSWQRHALGSGELLARHITLAQQQPGADINQIVAREIGGEVVAVASYARDGSPLATAGARTWQRHLPDHWRASAPPRHREIGGQLGPAMVVFRPHPGGAVAVVLRADPAALRIGPLVGLVALYTGLLGLALLAVLHLVLTRLVVTPIEQLSLSAARVADGGRVLQVPPRAGGELAELATSLSRMTATLVADEQALRDKIQQLKAAAQELQQAQDTVVQNERLASVGRLAAGLAHEIGNPLAAILAIQELLLSGDDLTDETRDFIQRMKRETDRVHHVLRDLLTFARPARQIGDDAIEAVCNVREVVEHVVMLVRPQQAFSDVMLQVTLEDHLPAVAMSPHHLEQVLLNLLLNAADVVPKPGGHVWLRATTEGNVVQLTLEDDGGGVAPAVKGRIFEPFVTSKEVGHGTGLGLAVCRGLVEATGGTLEVEDGDDGARFLLALPQAPTPSSYPSSAP